ncbi:hypothetical protein [Candidatus Magnetominusculus xianensis]|nr:hypothetical protein [Candidatus Magnetominusculus xianensis]MBF0405280.1 hypothetical protein [Nitrospirota bacterium]
MTAIWLHGHLIINHIPMLWAVFAFILYYYGTIIKNSDIQKAALLGFAVTAALTWCVFRTGEIAASYVAGLPLLSLDYLYEHEQWAEKSAWAIYAAGGIAFVGAVKIWLRRQLHGLFFIFFSIAAVAAISLSAITSDIGSKIANSALRPNSKLIKSLNYSDYKEQRKKSGTLQSDKTPVSNELTIKPVVTEKPNTSDTDNLTTATPVTNAAEKMPNE